MFNNFKFIKVNFTFLNSTTEEPMVPKKKCTDGQIKKEG